MHIITLGGGGFSMEPDNLALERYIIAQTEKDRPRVCFLPQASGEAQQYLINFYRAFSTKLDCRASDLSLFQPHTADIEDFLMNQDVIYVGGGNTKSMLALWRAWGLDRILKQAAENGTILAGISAGCICWYEQGLTDSIPGDLTALPCLGYLTGSATPHYDGEAKRRPSYQRFVGEGEIMPGYAYDDGAAGHWVDGKLLRCIASRPNAKAYFVEKTASGAKETAMEMVYLGNK
jgi:dipeptidase E